MANGFGNPDKMMAGSTSVVISTCPDRCWIYSKAQQVDLRSKGRTGSKDAQLSIESKTQLSRCVFTAMKQLLPGRIQRRS